MVADTARRPILRMEPSLEPRIGTYLRALTQTFEDINGSRFGGRTPNPESVFALLTHRRFTHLTRLKAAHYKDGVTASLRRDIEAGSPLRFYYDIGAGYRASVRKDRRSLAFRIGLGELCLLHQVACFHRAACDLYSGGTRFTLVVDNFCALFTNDIPVDKTRSYMQQLRHLIHSLGLSDIVDVLIESETFSLDEYRATFNAIAAQPDPDKVSDADIDNVERFLGRPCSIDEVSMRMEKYRRSSIATETLLASKIRGVRLTQRATPGTLGFRSFGGGDQRIQTGNIALTSLSSGKIVPVLITSRNVDDYSIRQIDCSSILPDEIPVIDYAFPL